MKTNFDLIIIGAGAAGYSAAFKAKHEGLEVALIEKEKIGGICLNWGCVPSKSLQASAELFVKIKKAQNFGLSGVDFGKIKPDWNLMLERASGLAKQFSERTEIKLLKSEIELIKGEAKVLSPTSIEVEGKILQTKDLILATGSHYVFPEFLHDIPGSFYNPKTIYQMPELPKRMTVIGGGVIGVEFACLFADLGVNVTLVDAHTPLMPYMDHDLTNYLLEILHRKNIKLYSGYKALSLNSKKLIIQHNDKLEEIESDVFLSAIARKGNLTGLENLISKGLELKNSHIRTDLQGRTTLPHVYAVGDVNGHFMTAHVAAKEGVTAVESILGKGKDLIYDFMPYNMYSNPEFASVGMTERQALNKGFLVSTGIFSLGQNAKLQADGETDGFIKVVFDKKSEEILGIHLATKNATDLIGEAIVAMSSGMKIKDFANLTHPHPTLSEGLVTAVFKGMGET